MKLIVGLGNPGIEYKNTRHNIGFIYINMFAESLNKKIDKEKFNGLYDSFTLNNEKIILLKPLSYMNLSGEVVSEFVKFFKINTEDILVISDDLDMNLGKIKLKQNGSSGGHNGIKNIIQCLGTDNFKRLKIGISNDKKMDTKDYVLGKFTKEELQVLEDISSEVIDILVEFTNTKFDKIMNKHNRK